METYGDFIKRHRILSGYKSQRRLAEKSGISNATISRIEANLHLPEVETLKQLAPYLTSTSLVELMVVCGYWDEDELLEDLNEGQNKSKYINTKNERGFLHDIDLSDEELLKRFDIKIDGKSLSKEEAQGIIAYVRSLRQMNRN